MLLTVTDTKHTLSQFQTYKVSGSHIPVNTKTLKKYDEKQDTIHPYEFYTALAHEVRNPLTNIVLSVDMLESGKGSENQQYLEIIKRSTARISALVDTLVSYQQAQKHIEVKCSVHQLLDEVISISNDRFTLKHISITKVYALNDFEIALDRPEMILALTNIVINAIEAMAPDNGRLRLVTRSMADKYVISIEDNGCGISKKNLRNIFKPYYTNKKNGLGIGLSSTFDILRANHVGIKVESKENFGTSFILSFQKHKN